MSAEKSILDRFDVVTSTVELDGESLSIVHPRDADALIDEAAFNRDERLPYWADVWPASIALARTVHAMNGAGRSLLELGCGIGLVASAAMKAGFVVTASDYYEDALEFTRVNSLRNAGRPAETLLLDWRQLPLAVPAYDVVAASDVLYEPAYGPIVSRAIATMLAEGGRALIADPGRVGTPAFFGALGDVGLKHVGAAVVTVSHRGRDTKITVHEVGR
ncbi:MAG TPA: methyltransferase domain-containing protein [Gemmatimonadaceae bacterium]